MIDSFLFLYVAFTAMADVMGLDEEELDYDEGGAGAAGTVGVSSTGDDGDAGTTDDILTGSGLATLSKSNFLAGEDETSHVEFGDPPAESTPEPMEVVTAALPQASKTHKSAHYNTSWMYCDFRIQEILSRIECILKSKGVSDCPFVDLLVLIFMLMPLNTSLLGFVWMVIVILAEIRLGDTCVNVMEIP